MPVHETDATGNCDGCREVSCTQVQQSVRVLTVIMNCQQRLTRIPREIRWHETVEFVVLEFSAAPQVEATNRSVGITRRELAAVGRKARWLYAFEHKSRCWSIEFPDAHAIRCPRPRSLPEESSVRAESKSAVDGERSLAGYPK